MNTRCRSGLSRSLRFGTGILAIAVSGAVAQPAVDSATPAEASPPKWAWRQLIERKISEQHAMLSTLAAKPQVELSPLLLRPGRDPDVLILPAMRVWGDRAEKRLREKHARQEQQEKQDALMRRLGNSYYGLGGENSSVGVATVFYVPFFAGYRAQW